MIGLPERYPVTSMAISITSALLIVGTSTGHIQIYDIASQQLIHSIVAHKDFSINDVRTMLKPRDLMGHASLGDPTSFKESNPIRSIAPFQRTRDPKTRENHEVLMMPPAHPAVWPAVFFTLLHAQSLSLFHRQLILEHRDPHFRIS